MLSPPVVGLRRLLAGDEAGRWWRVHDPLLVQRLLVVIAVLLSILVALHAF